MQNSEKIILDLCGGTGSWSKPYKDAGYDVRIITLPDNDVMTYKPPENVYGILAAPPCTEFSVLNCIAEARARDEEAGMKIVNACLRIIEKCSPKFVCMENPTGFLRQQIGKPTLTFQPWNYGDAWTKRTDLWGYFNAPEFKFKKWDELEKLPIYIRPNREKPSIAFLHKSSQALIPQLKDFICDTDAAFRAITPPGFAKAFYEANQ